MVNLVLVVRGLIYGHLWKDLKMAVHWQTPFNLTELERMCREEW